MRSRAKAARRPAPAPSTTSAASAAGGADRSPISQNSMPRTCASGASVSSSAISAPQPAATTTPVSSRRVGVHAPVAARPARTNTSSVDANAPRERRRRIDQRPRPASIARQRADGRAAGDAEHVRIGERIAQQHLHQRAGERERAADGERGQRARQPQLAHDRARRCVAVGRQRAQDGRRIDRRCCRRAQRQRERRERNGGEGGESQRRGNRGRRGGLTTVRRAGAGGRAAIMASGERDYRSRSAGAAADARLASQWRLPAARDVPGHRSSDEQGIHPRRRDDDDDDVEDASPLPAGARNYMTPGGLRAAQGGARAAGRQRSGRSSSRPSPGRRATATARRTATTSTARSACARSTGASAS